MTENLSLKCSALRLVPRGKLFVILRIIHQGRALRIAKTWCGPHNREAELSKTSGTNSPNPWLMLSHGITLSTEGMKPTSSSHSKTAKSVVNFLLCSSSWSVLLHGCFIQQPDQARAYTCIWSNRYFCAGDLEEINIYVCSWENQADSLMSWTSPNQLKV